MSQKVTADICSCLLFARCPTEAFSGSIVECHEAQRRGKTGDAFDVRRRDKPSHGAEHSVERLLISLVLLLLKQNSASAGEQDSLFVDGATTPVEAEGLRREVKMRCERHPCRDKGEADTSSPGPRTGISDGGGPVLRPNPCDRGTMQSPQGPIQIVVPRVERALTPSETRGEAAVWICPPAHSACNLAATQPLLQHKHTSCAAERSTFAMDSPHTKPLVAPDQRYPQAASSVAGTITQAAAGFTRHKDSATSSPAPLPKAPAQVERGRQRLLAVPLKDQTAQTNQESTRPAGMGRTPAVPIVPCEQRPLRADAAPLLVIRARASSQPHPSRASQESILFSSRIAPSKGPTVPPSYLVQPALRAEGNSRPSGIDGSSCQPSDRGVAVIKTLHQHRQGDTNGFVLVGSPRGALSPTGAVGATLARVLKPPFLGDLSLPCKEGNINSARLSSGANGISRIYFGNMIPQGEQESSLAGNDRHLQQLSPGPGREQQQQQGDHPQQHHLLQHLMHQPGLPVSPRRSSPQEDRDKRGGSTPSQPHMKVHRAAMDPGVPILLQKVTAPEERGRGDCRAAPNDLNKQNNTIPGRGVERVHAGRTASPEQRLPVLGPFTAWSQQPNKPSSSVSWGRSKAIGANGTPMVSPRKKGRTSSLGHGEKSNETGLHRESALTFDSEMHFQRPPNITFRTIPGEGTRGKVLGEDSMDRRECTHMSNKQLFGAPSLPSRDSTTQRRQGDNDTEERHEKLRDFAMWRRGRRIDNGGLEFSGRIPPPKPDPTVRLGKPGGLQEGQVADYNEKTMHPSACRAASTGHAKNIAEVCGERRSAARPGASGAEGPSVLLTRPGDDKQLSSPQLASSSRLSSSARPIDSCCPRHTASRPSMLETAGRRHHPPLRKPQLLLDVASSGSSGTSWESWEPLLQGELATFSLPISEEEASRLRDEFNEGGEGTS